jgi:hypothetical protein
MHAHTPHTNTHCTESSKHIKTKIRCLKYLSTFGGCNNLLTALNPIKFVCDNQFLLENVNAKKLLISAHTNFIQYIFYLANVNILTLTFIDHVQSSWMCITLAYH